MTPNELLDHYKFKVKLIKGSTDPLKAITGISGFLHLDRKSGAISFFDPTKSTSAPIFSYHSREIANISTQTRGLISKKQFLTLTFDREAKRNSVTFEVKEEKANITAATILSFQNEMKTQPKPSQPFKVFEELGVLAHNLEKKIGKEFSKISLIVQDQINDAIKIGEKLKAGLELDLDPKEITNTSDELVDVAEASGIFDAIFGSLMAKGMISAAVNEDYSTSLNAFHKAKETATQFQKTDQVEEANQQINRIKVLSKENTEFKISEIEEEDFQSKKISKNEAQKYLEGVEKILEDWKSQSINLN